jgi:hypothetical protein
VAVDINRVVASAIETAFEGEEHHEPRRSRHRGVKALAAGAALVATARVVGTYAPKLSKLGALSALGKATQLPDMVRDIPDRLRDRLADSGWLPADSDVEDEDFDEDEGYDEEDDYGAPEDEQPEDEQPEDEQPEDVDSEGEGDEGPDDEGGGGPDDEDEGEGGGGGDATEPEPDEDDEQPQAVASGSAIEQAAEGLELDTNGHRASGQGAAPDVIGILSAHGEPPPLLTRTDRSRHIDPVTRPPKPPTESESRSKPDSRSGSKSKSSSGSGSKSKPGSSRGSKSKSSPGSRSSSKSKSSSGSGGKSKSSSRGNSKPGSRKSGTTRSGAKKAKAGSK